VTWGGRGRQGAAAGQRGNHRGVCASGSSACLLGALRRAREWEQRRQAPLQVVGVFHACYCWRGWCWLEARVVAARDGSHARPRPSGRVTARARGMARFAEPGVRNMRTHVWLPAVMPGPPHD
jgi:hypothetical protein